MITKVLPDANVLFSKTLRDWLFMLRNHAGGGFYTVHSTEDIVCEVGYSFRRQNPEADGGRLTRLVDCIRDNVDSLISEYPTDPDYAGTDANDRHVHAAAITDDVDMLLTIDGGLLALEDSRYEVSTPDDFFCLADDSQPHIIRAVALQQAEYWSKRGKGNDLAHYLTQALCPNFAERVTERLAEAMLKPVGEARLRVLRYPGGNRRRGR